ncbi:putative virion structural protein 8 [Salmonella phage SPAsTU]|nr:putative virion structural protein 8 [Salmonella phage STsAS]AWN09020.1 putative virion structural protein 8 [Salmonella phage SPAsTU]
MEDISKITGDPAVASILRKSTGPSAQQERGKREEGGVTPTRSELTGIASSRIRTVKNAERIFDALPELEVIVTIATSSLLSTKDLINTTLIYDNVADIPIDLRSQLLEPVREFHDHTRQLPSKLYQWMYDALKSKGASPVMLISDTGFDQLFGLKPSVATESVRRSQSEFFEQQLGILGSINPSEKPKVGVESILGRARGASKPTKPQTLSINFAAAPDSPFKAGGELATLDITVTDNPRITMLPEAYRRVAQENARTGLFGQLEQSAYEQPTTPNGSSEFNADRFTDREEELAKQNLINLGDLNETYKNTPQQKLYAEVPKMSFADANKIEYTERLLPAESTLPLVIGDDVRNPIGYLTIVDEMGNFINSRSTLYGDANFMNYLNNDGMTDSTINRANLGMGNTSRVTPDIANRLTSRYGEIAEDQLTKALGEALGGAEISMTVTETFSRIMLARHLAKRHTQVIYIPAENLCYFATDFDEDGIGVSITERSFVISTVRMALLFATMNSAVLNSARHMQYDIELSPDDMNPQKTIDQVKTDIMNTYNRRQPMWGDMNDTWAMTTNAGVAFNVTGNDYYASTRISVSDTTPDYKAPDAEFDETLLRRTCHIAGVDPDLVMTPENIEFASQIFSKSLLVTQQITKKQEILSKPLTRYVVNGLLASPSLQSSLIKIIAEYINANGNGMTTDQITAQISEYLAKFINGMKVTLPPPDTSAAASQMDLFDKRIEFFEKLADLVVTEDLSNALQNEGIEMSPDDLKTMIKSFYARNWLRKQGIENEFFDLIYDDENRQDNIKMIVDDSITASKGLIQLAKKFTGRLETLAKNADLDPNAAPGGFDNSFGGDTTGGGDDDGFGGEGGGDGGLDDDLSLDIDTTGADDSADGADGADQTGGDLNAGSGDATGGDGTSGEGDLPPS